MRKSEATGAPTGREARTNLRFVVPLMCNPSLFSCSTGSTIRCHKEGTTAPDCGGELLLVEGLDSPSIQTTPARSARRSIPGR